ncbi:MAG: GPR endopeptidase [Lachnospiraceae bacterium]|nr:GPR endopeptidase [Lachnospiraceae bacterium]
MEGYCVRTDLALESAESMQGPKQEMNGVTMTEEYHARTDVTITTVIIESKNASKRLGKPGGTYITLEAPSMHEEDEEYHREISKELADCICKLLPRKDGELSVLVVGLGNRGVTADSLGPLVIDNLHITRHVLLEYGTAAYEGSTNMISGIVPGVMAKTGMESMEIVRGVADNTNPDVILVVDALAARSTKRLNRTIQITNTGIHPGSGVGNHRSTLNEESLGCPVIAIGIPTVVDAATIVNDAVGRQYEDIPLSNMTELSNMYVTGKDIDEVIKRLSYTISEGINMALKCSH